MPILTVYAYACRTTGLDGPGTARSGRFWSFEDHGQPVLIESYGGQVRHQLQGVAGLMTYHVWVDDFRGWSSGLPPYKRERKARVGLFTLAAEQLASWAERGKIPGIRLVAVDEVSKITEEEWDELARKARAEGSPAEAGPDRPEDDPLPDAQSPRIFLGDEE
jgi:hypothetical protein